MDPNVMEAKVIVSACGHDGPFGAHSVKRLATLGMLPPIQGMGGLDMNSVHSLYSPSSFLTPNPMFRIVVSHNTISADLLLCGRLRIRS